MENFSEVLPTLPPIICLVVILVYLVFQDRKRVSQEMGNHKETVDMILSLKEAVTEEKLDIKTLEHRVNELEDEIKVIKKTIAEMIATK